MTTIIETTDAAAANSTIYQMGIGDTFQGGLGSSGDNDWIEIVVQAGQTINVLMTGTSGAIATGNNVTVSIVNAAGGVIAAETAYTDSTSTTTYTNTTGAAQTLYIHATDFGNTDTGTYTVAVTTPPPASPLDSIDWGGSALASPAVTVYFAAAGEVFDGVTSLGWTQTQINNVMAALADMAKGTALTFTVTASSAAATFKMVTENNTGVSYSAYMNPPSVTNPGVGVFNTANMNLDNLIQGSLDYFIIQHEAGHALGLAHPHDTGGGSVIMNGVSDPFNDLGDYNLNQGINTIMSYNPGYYQLYGYPSGTYGATVGPMALDLALLQQKYGSVAANTGNNVYTLPGTNATGTFFSTIWDTGGTDEIRYTGALNVVISLVAATLDYSATGGGGVSFAAGIQGGYTVANGVVIENATGGSGHDLLVGNATVANVLTGNAGRDILIGKGAAGDTLNGGAESDWLAGNAGAIMNGGSGVDWFHVSSTSIVQDYTVSDFIFSNSLAAPVFSISGGDVLVNGARLTGAAALDTVTLYVSGSSVFTDLQANSALIASLINTGAIYLENMGNYSRYRFDANNNNTWRVIQDGYVGISQLDFQWTWNDAGNAVYATYIDYDQYGTNPWTTLTNYYSAANVLDYRWTINDVGQTHQSLFTDWDQAGTNTWTSRINYYTAPGVLDVQWTYNDVGQFHAQLFTDWDQANANTWSYRINYYTTPGVLDYQWTYNDAGNPIHSINTDWDQTSVATWSYRQTYYSALNVADYQWTFNDAGNPIHSTMYDWDQGNTAIWTNRTTYYSAANVADYQWTFYDAGQTYHSQYVDFDQANAQPWAYHVINFSAPGVVANDYYV